MSASVVKFAQLQSCADVSFWSELAERKLNQYKLSDAAIPVTGWVSASRYSQVPGQMQVDCTSFPSSTLTADHGLGSLPHDDTVDAGLSTITKQGMHSIPGVLLNYNTLEAFKSADKVQLLRQAAERLWSDLQSGAAEANPALLMRFLLITFSDLKNFRFTYWFAFPVLKPPSPFATTTHTSSLEAALGADTARKVCGACDAWRGLSPPSAWDTAASCQPRQDAPVWLLHSASGQWEDTAPVPLTRWQEVHQSGKVMLAVSDTSNLDGHPGWLLRNVLLMVAVRWRVSSMQVVCCRDNKGHTDPVRTQLLSVALPDIPSSWCAGAAEVPEPVGWEPNAEGRLLPREMHLAAQMSPHHLAEQAVDLNLHLMKWRAAPALDTARVAQTKCLLLGAGTLGCAVARTLLGWGVRHITFLDSSKVAFSNPVRQSLYEFQDCLEGGKPKAQAAAAAVQRIFPSAQCSGLAVSIPMPGHPPSTPGQLEEARQAAAQLDDLVQGHDVVFLLTDTRESRWLPSLLAAAHNKVAITSAVGFDSFVVMRHGAAPQASPPYPGYCRLGCYFCNDVVAPLNSTRDRTLDQQCTVARPGLAPIASAVAVELLVALLQHPQRQLAPPPSYKPSTVATGCSDASAGRGSQGGAAPVSSEGELGVVPHMVRGQLSGFQQTCMEGAAFSQCTACSDTVVQRYKQDGWQFVLQALQEPKFLENITGLTELHQQALDMLESDEEEEKDAKPRVEGDDSDESFEEL